MPRNPTLPDPAAGPEPPAALEPGCPALSEALRLETAPLHREVESLLRLPGVIRDAQDYRRWLGRLLGLYEPLERALAAFPAWRSLDLPLPSPSRNACLAADLAALAVDQRDVARAARAVLPALPGFAHALGARYVIEGAALGGRLILRDLEARLGPSIAGATRFFGGPGEAGGAAIGPTWRDFRAALDAFGYAQPERRRDVIAGAESCFRAHLAWFEPFCAESAAAA